MNNLKKHFFIRKKKKTTMKDEKEKSNLYYPEIVLTLYIIKHELHCPLCSVDFIYIVLWPYLCFCQKHTGP